MEEDDEAETFEIDNPLLIVSGIGHPDPMSSFSIGVVAEATALTPGTWGVLLADIVRNVARLYPDPDAAADEILRLFDAEMDSPTEGCELDPVEN